eukprot:scaffold61302_cov33-Tisochrysis_lutea.AAC.2
MAPTLCVRTSTIDGSASVDTSPSWSHSRHAILRKIRRMILPDRVLGSPGVTTMQSGIAMPPMPVRTACLSEGMRSAESAAPSWRTTYAKMPWPFTSCGMPTTAASMHAGWVTRADSISAVPSLCPDTLSTSSTRPVIQMKPSSSRRHPSPVKYLPGYGRRPGLADAQHALYAVALEGRAAPRVDDDGPYAKHGQRGGAGLHGCAAGQVGNHMATRLGLPKSVDHRAPALPDLLKVPPPRLRVDGLAHSAEDAQR